MTRSPYVLPAVEDLIANTVSVELPSKDQDSTRTIAEAWQSLARESRKQTVLLQQIAETSREQQATFKKIGEDLERAFKPAYNRWGW